MVFYKSSKQNDRNGWIRATVVSTKDHTVVCRRHSKGLPINVAYGDVRPIPNHEIVHQLASLDDDYTRQDEVSEYTTS